jgi:hypothetical protein
LGVCVWVRRCVAVVSLNHARSLLALPADGDDAGSRVPQMRTVVSSLAEANTSGLVGCHATELTERVCPASVSRSVWLCRCQRYTILSSDPDATKLWPAPPKHDRIANRACSCPMYLRTSCRVLRFHTWISADIRLSSTCPSERACVRVGGHACELIGRCEEGWVSGCEDGQAQIITTW